MRLVDDNAAVSEHEWVVHGLAQQHSVRHELQNGAVRVGEIFETDCIADLFAHFHIHFFRNSINKKRK